MALQSATDLDTMIAQRNELLRAHEIERETIEKAWFIMAHLLLNDDSHVVHMGCQEGAVTFVMAALYPHIHFTGLDKSKRKIAKANTLYDLDNLEFKVGDATSGLFNPDSLDAIIDSHFLNVIYADGGYSANAVKQALKAHDRMLKKGGQIFLRDFAAPPLEEFVLLEMPDQDSEGEDLDQLSDPDLLIWFAENVRTAQDIEGYSGFFIEELPAQFEGTRLFRLPHKWAYEFIMGRENCHEWIENAPREYTYFTADDMRGALKDLGMRVPYAAPYWDESVIRDKFIGQFRLYRDDRGLMDYPSLSYIVVGVKVGERGSLQVLERRPSNQPAQKLRLETLQDEKTGELIDVVRRDFTISEILPYRIAPNGKLKIYLHSGLVRSIINAVPRSGQQISQQRFSGHMLEAVIVDANDVPDHATDNPKECQHFAREYVGLEPSEGGILEKGVLYYPAPDFIDEQIQSYFLSVQRPSTSLIEPLKRFVSSYRFHAKGDVDEFDAQQVLDAISIGLIPSARLEIQILALFEHLKIKPENWTQEQIEFEKGEIIRNKTLGDYLALEDTPGEFIETERDSHKLRCINSVFVEEGLSHGASTGLSHEDVEFIVHNGQTENIAVVLPLSKSAKSGVNAGFMLENMPVPARHEGNGQTVSAPKFPLPPDVTNIRQAKRFLADHFHTMPEHIIKMGEPYFTHVGITPQRIYPFAVVLPPDVADPPGMGFIPYYQMMLLRRSLSKDPHMMTLLGRAYRHMNDHLHMDPKMSAKFMASKSFDYHGPSLSVPLDYYRAPSLPDVPEPTTPSLQEQNNANMLQHQKDLEQERLKTKKKKRPLKQKEKAEIAQDNDVHLPFDPMAIMQKVAGAKDTPAPNLDAKSQAHVAQQKQSMIAQAASAMKNLVEPFLVDNGNPTAPKLGQNFEQEFNQFMEAQRQLEAEWFEENRLEEEDLEEENFELERFDEEERIELERIELKRLEEEELEEERLLKRRREQNRPLPPENT